MLAIFAFALPLVFPLAAQTHFDRGEKATVGKFKRAKAHFAKGLDFLKNGDPAQAQKEAAASLEIFPGYADGHLLLALLRRQEGNFEPPSRRSRTPRPVSAPSGSSMRPPVGIVSPACVNSGNGRPSGSPNW